MRCAAALISRLPASIYQAQIGGDSQATDPTAFTVEFSITPESPGAAVISDRDAISGWLNADVELSGTVHVGSRWTIRLDGTNYTYPAEEGDTLSDVAEELVALLPAVYNPVQDSQNGAALELSRTDNTPFRVSFSFASATNIRPQLVFRHDNWDVPQNVLVSAADDDVVDGGDAKVVAAVEGRVNAIRGPLTINGGLSTGVDRALNDPFLLPGEKNSPLRDGFIDAVGTDSDGNAFLTDTSAIHVDPVGSRR